MKIYVDGNPHKVCVVAEDGTEYTAPIGGKNTNNIAEYRAVLFGLYKFPDATKVCSDSQLVVGQLNTLLGRGPDRVAIRAEHLQALANRVLARVKVLGHDVCFVWVRGTSNPAGKVLG